MHFPALLYLCIWGMLGLIQTIPIHQDSLKTMVKLQADTIILRIEEHHKMLNLSTKIVIESELLPEVSSDKAIQGLGSIVDTLTTFQKLLRRLPNGHGRQIRNDLSTLLGYLKDRMTSMRCAPKEQANEKSSDAFIEKNTTHHITFGYLALDRLKQFMQKLIVNLDHLKRC